MELHRDEQQKPREQHLEEKSKRFRLIKLEERIAPKRHGKGSRRNCGCGTGGSGTGAGSASC